MNEKIAIIATTAALVSSIMALISWWYNRELSRASVSLVEVKVDGKRVRKDKLSVNFLFIFRNVGKETLKISQLHLGHVDFKRKIFEKVGKEPILNPIHTESIFNYSTSFIIDIDPQIPNEALGNVLPTIVGKHAIILKLKYKGTSVFSRKEMTIKY
ncbi:MAG: hypothetical protein AB1348_06040 [Nitrospirota bacterium]